MTTLLPNAYLDRPSIVWAWEWYLTSSFPITFPWTFDAAPFRFSTLDLYPGSPLGDVLFEARLLEKPQIKFQSTDAIAGLEQVDQVTLRLVAAPVARVLSTGSVITGDFDPTGFDPTGFLTAGIATGMIAQVTGLNLHTWVAGEHRGKLLVGHLVQLDNLLRTVTVQQNLFRGETLAMSDDPDTVSVIARAFDLTSFTELLPSTLVSTDWAPYAPTASYGQAVPVGIGIGRRIPCVPVKAQTLDAELFKQPFTATPATDLLTIPSHFLDTGAGPFRLSTTGTLPAPLLATVDYWVIAFDDDNVELALTLGDALTGTAIDITTTGTGFHTMTGGLAPYNGEDYDVIVAHGNVGILRMWEDASAQGSTAGDMPDVPVTYQVQHKQYRPGGRYATSVRYQDQLDGLVISADILRVYPDVDDAVIGEWKWLTGFEDGVNAFDAVSARSAPQTVTSADLVPTHQRYGLGGVNLNGSKWFELYGGGPTCAALDTFTIEIEFIPSLTGSTNVGLAAAPRDNGPIAGQPFPTWTLFNDQSIGRVGLYVVFLDGTTWNANSAAGVVPNGMPCRVTVVRDGSTGTTSVYVGRTQILTDTRAAKLAYGMMASQSLILGMAQNIGFIGTLGYCRYSAKARTQREIDNAYYLWRHNPIEFCRELATDAKRLVNGASFDAAAAAIDAVQAGTLKADGYALQQNAFGTMLDAMVPFRDLEFSIGSDLRLAVDVAAPPTTLQGSFGHGDDYGNLLQLPTRARASLTEVPRSVTVRFRRSRSGAAGPFGGYAMEIKRTVFGVGADATPLELPFVDSTVTADQIADFRAKRLKTRDQIIEFSLGHEARNLTKGGAIRLNVPAMGITDLDLETVALAKGAERVDGRGVPTNAADFTYTPMPLPADPVDRTLQVTDLGQVQSLLATLANGRLTLQVALADEVDLPPVGQAPWWNFALDADWPNVVGASSEWQATDDIASPDDIGSYIEATVGSQRAYLDSADLPLASAIIDGIAIRARARSTTAASALNWQIFYGNPTGSFTTISDFWSLSTPGAWTNLLATPPILTTFGGAKFTLADVNSMGFYLQPGALSGGNTVQVTAVALVAYVRRELPLEAGFVRYWIRGPFPGTTPPPAPLEAEQAQFVALDLAPQATDLTGTTGDKFWIWAGIYDEFGRRILLVGPTPVVV